LVKGEPVCNAAKNKVPLGYKYSCRRHLPDADLQPCITHAQESTCPHALQAGRNALDSPHGNIGHLLESIKDDVQREENIQRTVSGSSMLGQSSKGDKDIIGSFPNVTAIKRFVNHGPRIVSRKPCRSAGRLPT